MRHAGAEHQTALCGTDLARDQDDRISHAARRGRNDALSVNAWRPEFISRFPHYRTSESHRIDLEGSFRHTTAWVILKPRSRSRGCADFGSNLSGAFICVDPRL